MLCYNLKIMGTKPKLKLILTILGFTLTLFGFAPVNASSDNISRSYQASNAIANGSLVSLVSNHSNYVEASNSDNGSSLLGVAVSSSDSLLAINVRQGTVQVATTGDANTLVSTVNGSIKVGDQVGVSPFSGIGMKAAINSRVIGLAQTSFDSSSAGSSLKVKDKNGNLHQLKVGFVRVAIGIGNSTSQSAPLSGLQKFGQSLTGHTVSTFRVAVSVIITAVAFIALITLIYAAIYGSLVSLGRNPLAKFAIFRTLRAVVGMALLTSAIASIAVYILLA